MTRITYMLFLHNSYYLHVIYITRILKFIFLGLIKNIFLVYIKMVNNGYQNHRERITKNKYVKDIKIFLKKKKTKGEKMLERDIKILLKKKKKKTSILSGT